VEQVEACRQVAVKEARLGKAEIDLSTFERTTHAETQELAVAEQVALRYRDVADHAFTGRITGTEGQFPSRLLDKLDIENHAVLR